MMRLPPPVSQGAMTEALRSVRAVLAGEPVPAQHPASAQQVIVALAVFAAGQAAGVLMEKGYTLDEAYDLALVPLEAALAELALGEGSLFVPTVPLEDQDFGAAVDPEVGGCILAREVPDGYQFKASVRPELTPGERELFADWAAQRFTRFAEHGPEPDAWQEQSCGGVWQLWARRTEMPPLD